MEKIQISAKVLGSMALADFCPRCFWIKLHVKKLPWQIFPGIFSSIDAYTKKVVHHWIDQNAGVPFLKEYAVVGYEKVPHWSKFRTETEHGIILTGVPDDIWTTKSSSFVVPDYKTAKFTANQDKLLPMYRIQLNGYARIAEATGIVPVVALPLIYMEPQTETGDAAWGAVKNTKFSMAFEPKVLPVAYDPEVLDPLLKRARDIYDGGVPDEREGCEDCKAFDNIEDVYLAGLQYATG